MKRNSWIQLGFIIIVVVVWIVLEIDSFQEVDIKLLQVIDGDTIEVSIEGEVQKIRFIGIDAPEVYPTLECKGMISTEEVQNMLTSDVVLVSKPLEDVDAYGRLLRYVEVDSKDVGLHLLEKGLAKSYNRYPHPRMSKYKAAEAKAKSARLGIWSVECM